MAWSVQFMSVVISQRNSRNFFDIGKVHTFLDAKIKLQRPSGFVACHERNILQLP